MEALLLRSAVLVPVLFQELATLHHVLGPLLVVALYQVALVGVDAVGGAGAPSLDDRVAARHVLGKWRRLGHLAGAGVDGHVAHGEAVGPALELHAGEDVELEWIRAHLDILAQ